MPTILEWKGDGLTAGALTTGSAGSGDTPPSGLLGSGQALVSSGARPAAIQLAQVSGQNCGAYWTIGTTSSFFFRSYVTFENTLATNHTIVRVGSGTTRGFDLNVTGTGIWRLYNAANTLVTESSSGLVQQNTLYRISGTVTLDAVTIHIYQGHTNTLVATLSGGSTNAFGTSFTRFTIGNPTSTPTAEAQRWDDIILSSDAEPGSAEAPIAPSAVVTIEQALVIDARTSTPSGSVFSISQTSGPVEAPTEIATGLWLVTRHATTTRTYTVTASANGQNDSENVSVNPSSDPHDTVEYLFRSNGSWI